MSSISEHNEYLRQQQPQSIPNSHFLVIPSSPTRNIPINHTIPITTTTEDHQHTTINNTSIIYPRNNAPVNRNISLYDLHIPSNNQEPTPSIDTTTTVTKKKYLISEFFNKKGEKLSSSKLQPSPTSSNFFTNALDPPTISVPDTVPDLSLNDTPIDHIILPTSDQQYDNIYQAQSKKKTLLQRHLLKKPIANDWWGSSMDSKDPDCTRIFFQNINGLTIDDSIDKWKVIVNAMHEKECSIFGFAETNTNWRYDNIKIL